MELCLRRDGRFVRAAGHEGAHTFDRQFRTRSGSRQSPPGQHGDPIADREQFLQVLGHDQQRDTAVAQIDQCLTNELGRTDIDRQASGPQGITVEGELTSDEDVVIQGTLRGKLVSKDTVNVESGAVVEADISASSLSVGGQITGNVTASDRVDLMPGGRLIGDVKASRLTIADGASFKGNVDMDV